MADFHSDDNDRTPSPRLYPDLAANNSDIDDKYTYTHGYKPPEESNSDKWECPISSVSGKKEQPPDGETVNTTKNQERRRNNRLQGGAMGDKYHNAHRFPGGHQHANANRQNPSNSASLESRSRHQNHDTEGVEYNHKSEPGKNTRQRSPKPSHVHKETKDFVFFWREGSPFSQWHPAKFTLDGLEFNCAEQYMMYNKAKMMNNEGFMDIIIKEKEPHAQKDYGRKIPEFDFDRWMTIREEVVKKGNIAKFSQNEDLKKKLFLTYPKTLVEASPHDQVWGIGLSAYDKDALKKETWKGENLLGKILTEVRDELLKEVGFL